MKSWKTPEVKKLANALLSIKTEKDMINFLRDVGTLEEIREWANRWKVVQLLDKNIPYREIAEKTGVSTTTVTRIAHWLNHGESGYLAALRETKKK